MGKYIIVYQGCSSYYNSYTGQRICNKAIHNYEVEASSKEDAYNKFLEYANKEKRDFERSRDLENPYASFTILNIINLKEEY